MSSKSVIWIGRVRAEDSSAAISVRVETDGRGPTPEDPAEWIEDPFADPWGDPWTAACAAQSKGPIDLRERPLLAPVRARKVLGIGRNYRAHAEELGNEVPTTPLVFAKMPTCLIGCGAPIPIPAEYDRVDMESELVVVIGRRGRRITRADAWQHVAGYTLGNDVSCRDLQKRDKQWTRAKGMDGFGPCGPMIRMCPSGWVPPIESMSVRGWLDDELRQDGGCSLMVFDVPTLIEHISETITLEPGDLIYSGTPAGVSKLEPGRRVTIRCEGRDFSLGTLTNPCVRAER
jgi:2-keto-4-pentenoate hydratase/2-oxohepta-3-ene-1,7-dioic acid hydratase in catechol pathway